MPSVSHFTPSYLGGRFLWTRCIYSFSAGFCPLTKYCQVQTSLWVCIQVLPRYCTALDQWASAELCGMVRGMELRNFLRGCHLYSAGRASCWLSAHILVFFFLAYSQPSQIWCLPSFHTWCGSRANLGCRSKMCCTWLVGNAARNAKIVKNLPSVHHRTTLSGHTFATKAHIDMREKIC